MAADPDVRQEDLDLLNSLQSWLSENPEPSLLPLLLGLYGDGDGCGLYAAMNHLYFAFEPASLEAPLVDAITNGPQGGAFWVLQIAANFPSPALVDPIAASLGRMDSDGRSSAVAALEAIGTPESMDALRKWRPYETEHDILALLADLGIAPYNTSIP